MNEQYIIEIEKNKEMIHQGDVFDQCSIGGDKNHYYQSGDLKNNELLIREIAGVYNIIPNSPNWRLNGNQLEEKKVLPIGKKRINSPMENTRLILKRSRTIPQAD